GLRRTEYSVRLRLLIVSIVGAPLAVTAASQGSQDQYQSFDVNVPQAPLPVVCDGRVMLAYELHVTNFTHEKLQLLELRALAGDSSRTIATFRNQDLIDRVSIVGAPAHSPTGPVVEPGARAIVFIELQLAPGERVSALRHELDYGLPDGSASTLRPEETPVSMRPASVLGPPLRGGLWVAVHDPTWATGHRRVTYTMGGKVRLPGRFAVDWVGTDAAGRISTGNPDHPSDSIGYNADVLAGADAEVAAVRDNLTESASIQHNPKHVLGEGAGNFVALRLGPDRFAFYEHLRPGSVRVRVGERVRKGQVIGSLGFSGDTTGPHLHLHVAGCGQTLQCEGVPFTIEAMSLLGRYQNITDLGQRVWSSEAVRRPASPEWPSYNVVIRFP
ncbi:MAG TPA: peptidoglycan DD-metalloendopeptidase family protein, partial [Steroidobacteraceae bacterium]